MTMGTNSNPCQIFNIMTDMVYMLKSSIKYPDINFHSVISVVFYVYVVYNHISIYMIYIGALAQSKHYVKQLVDELAVADSISVNKYLYRLSITYIYVYVDFILNPRHRNFTQ